MPIINFKNYDYSEMHVVMLGNSFVVGVKTIEYSESQEKSLVYGAGSSPIGIGKGTKSYAGKLGMHVSEVMKMKSAAQVNGAVDIPSFDLVVYYADGTNPFETVTLRGCQFTEESISVSSGDTEVLVDMPFIFVSMSGLPNITV